MVPRHHRPRRRQWRFRSCSSSQWTRSNLVWSPVSADLAGNLTGVSILNVELGPKRLQLLHEVVPTAAIMALIINPNKPNAASETRGLQAAAGALGLKLHVLHASTDGQLVAVFGTL